MARAASIDPGVFIAGFHALSDPTRLEILDMLRRGERCVCELVDVLGAAQSRLSFHLKVLREAGLITDRRDGRWVYYTLDPDALEALESYLASVRMGGGPRRGIARSSRQPIACCG